MNMVDIICRKKDGEALTKEEIEYFVAGYTEGSIPDYQASALLMAICLKHMNKEETYVLTEAMKNSGDIVDLSAIAGIKVDKHSTGGVGDKTTLIAGPLAAAAGVPVAKMSGRGLGFTGGTVDKLEAIPGFCTTMEENSFMALVNEKGISVIGQTAHIAPADKKIYALRDVTGTVENLSLVTASVMSKKLASGSDAMVLDVKCGDGAFMKTLEEASMLGELMVEIGTAAGKKTIAIITDMNQPLGNAVGNSLEVIEAIETLKGSGPGDITELSLVLAAYMIYAGGKAENPEEGRKIAEDALKSGDALLKFQAFVSGQNGNAEVAWNYDLFPQPSASCDVIATKEMMGGEGRYVSGIGAKSIGLASQHSGAGRTKKGDEIDLSAGIYLHKKTGDAVTAGDKLATVYGSAEKVRKGAEEAVRAFSFCAEKPHTRQLVQKVIMKKR